MLHTLQVSFLSKVFNVRVAGFVWRSKLRLVDHTCASLKNAECKRTAALKYCQMCSSRFHHVTH